MISLYEDDCIIEDGIYKMIVGDNFALFDSTGLVRGGYDYVEVDYLEVVEAFEDGHNVLDLDGEYPGLWQK